MHNLIKIYLILHIFIDYKNFELILDKNISKFESSSTARKSINNGMKVVLYEVVISCPSAHSFLYKNTLQNPSRLSKRPIFAINLHQHSSPWTWEPIAFSN